VKKDRKNEDTEEYSHLKLIKGKELDEFLGHLKTACLATSVSFKKCHQLSKGKYQLLKLYPAKKSDYGTVLGLLKNKVTQEVCLASMPGVFQQIPMKFHGVYEKVNLFIEKAEGRDAAKIKFID
jgi:hypothetical protein